MKQHITADQLKEVNLEKIHKLVRGDLKRHPFKPNEVTIGKMIEVLKKHYGYFEIVFHDKLVKIYFDKPTHENKELCDALWQAVKEIL